MTHRAVDAAAGMPAGSASNYFRTRDALFGAVVERFAERERANFEKIAHAVFPGTPGELVRTLAAVVHDSTGPQRTLTLARYALLVEGAIRPGLQEQLAATGARVGAWFTAWMRVAGSKTPEAHTSIVGNYLTGLVLHQLASPDPEFDAAARIEPLITTLITGGQEEL